MLLLHAAAGALKEAKAELATATHKSTTIDAKIQSRRDEHKHVKKQARGMYPSLRKPLRHPISVRVRPAPTRHGGPYMHACRACAAWLQKAAAKAAKGGRVPSRAQPSTATITQRIGSDEEAAGDISADEGDDDDSDEEDDPLPGV
jgi:hypothetical protein